MNDVFRMQVLQTKANVDEYFPDEILNEWFASLFLLCDHWVQISEGTVLNHDVDFLIVYKRVKVSYYIRWFQLMHHLNLLKSFKPNFLRNILDINYLDHIIRIRKEWSTLIRHGFGCRTASIHRYFRLSDRLSAKKYSFTSRFCYSRWSQALYFINLTKCSTS